ncbi:WEB family protein, chloroplastic [Heracleum sosnowskyi]|uniref:WEB family protein, chloroplastic n=1 Tax=Heracleum sosnowskyi TaxID=360622 RepID=A0AAD8H8S2_9APIA|nr:WEB family protein, chloroplastic [Heracleum sosnowskyi]
MHSQMRQLEEDLRLTKNQLDAAEEERDRALDQLREKMVANEVVNTRLSEALSPRRAVKLFAELTTVKELLSNSQKELAAKEKNIESMKLELDQAKQLEKKLADKDSTLSKLDEELHNAKVFETRAMDLYLESKMRIKELEGELEKGKQSEKRELQSRVSQSKQLEATKTELEESKLRIASLLEQLQKLKSSSSVSSREQNGIQKSDYIDPKNELGEKSASTKTVSSQREIDALKKELKAAIEAEEHSTKAMIDLALALKEVLTEGNQTKENLIATESELEHVKEVAEQLKVIVTSTEEKYQKLLDEAKEEVELHKNTADRLRVEAEESQLAWNGKEMGFVGVIKEVEEQNARTHLENVKLTDSLKAANTTSRKAREENHKLREIVRHALNETNAAKEAANIAKEEISELKDSLAEKDETLDDLTRECERLRISEAAANERMKELKRLHSQAHSELRTEDREEGGTAFMSPESVFDDHKEDLIKEDTAMKKGFSLDSAIKKGFSFDLHDIRLHSRFEDEDDLLISEDEDPVKAEALKGSIFDPSSITPRSESRSLKAPLFFKPHHRHHHRSRSTYTDVDTVNSEDSDNLDVSNHLDNSHHYSEETHSEDFEVDRPLSHSHRKKKPALLKSFSSLLGRKSKSDSHHSRPHSHSRSFHSKKEPTTPTSSTTSESHKSFF